MYLWAIPLTFSVKWSELFKLGSKLKIQKHVSVSFFQPFGVANPRRKSYDTINESEGHLVQENIDYEKIATITTPKYLDVEDTKEDMADPRKITLEDPHDLASASK